MLKFHMQEKIDVQEKHNVAFVRGFHSLHLL